jgi:hypothetical protein
MDLGHTDRGGEGEGKLKGLGVKGITVIIHLDGGEDLALKADGVRELGLEALRGLCEGRGL